MKKIFLVMTIAAILAVSLVSLGTVSARVGGVACTCNDNTCADGTAACTECAALCSGHQGYSGNCDGTTPCFSAGACCSGASCSYKYSMNCALPNVFKGVGTSCVGNPCGGGYGGAVCGNNAIEPPEVCDDGNTVTEYCGDNKVQSGAICVFDCSGQNYLSETCDNGGSNGVPCTPAYGSSCSYCSGSCSLVNVQGAKCGDGTVNPPYEQCEGNSQQGCLINGYAGVRTCNNCQFGACVSQESCGDGVKNGLEACDAGVNNGVQCTPAYGGSCTYCSSGCGTVDVQGAYCGDGTVNSPYEVCEGATVASCTINGYAGEKTCSGCQYGDCVPTEWCGDGIINDAEGCDDGADNGAQCTPEYGSSCTYCSSGCASVNVEGPYCGDGNVNSPFEQCEGSSTQNCDIGGYAGMQTCNAQCGWGACVSTQVSGDKIDALTTLKALPGNGVDPLKKAIEQLTKSMNPLYWIDATHVVCKTSPGGDSLVFDRERDAVYQLMKIRPTDSRYAAVQAVILEIVAVDRNLAAILINEAPAGNEKTNALKDLTTGDVKASQKRYKDAIEYYKKAWQHAEKVAPSCVGLHTILTGAVIGEETSGQGLFCRLFGWAC